MSACACDRHLNQSIVRNIGGRRVAPSLLRLNNWLIVNLFVLVYVCAKRVFLYGFVRVEVCLYCNACELFTAIWSTWGKRCHFDECAWVVGIQGPKKGLKAYKHTHTYIHAPICSYMRFCVNAAKAKVMNAQSWNIFLLKLLANTPTHLYLYTSMCRLWYIFTYALNVVANMHIYLIAKTASSIHRVNICRQLCVYFCRLLSRSRKWFVNEVWNSISQCDSVAPSIQKILRNQFKCRKSDEFWYLLFIIIFSCCCFLLVKLLRFYVLNLCLHICSFSREHSFSRISTNNFN